MRSKKKLTAIDLYAGVGGWALGLKLAGIDVVKSYEWWQPAADTHRANCGSEVVVGDIRAMAIQDFPTNIDIVVGSPPCTQFSYSNRGGTGDLKDGLRDVRKFFEVVRHVQPKYWAFENVPRVAKLLSAELEVSGELEEFGDLFEDAQIEIIDMSQFGLPQSRKRCIAGNFNFDLLASYEKLLPARTLGDVLTALGKGEDPNFKAPSTPRAIQDDETEAVLSWEEERFNREMKLSHPIYNGMSFPDRLDRASRTVTATCTRVSRESIVIHDEKAQGFRRLSVRERATLQGFPVHFVLNGSSHSEKLKMAGNAIPPSFTYLVASCMLGVVGSSLVQTNDLAANDMVGLSNTRQTTPDNPANQFPEKRRFRFAIPNLRFKSGTRFELNNIAGPEKWAVSFYYGDSKRIISCDFDFVTLSLIRDLNTEVFRVLDTMREEIVDSVGRIASKSLQEAWNRRSEDGEHPFDFLDRVGSAAGLCIADESWDGISQEEIADTLIQLLFEQLKKPQISEAKLRRFAKEILCGIAVCAAITEQGQSADTPLIAAE